MTIAIQVARYFRHRRWNKARQFAHRRLLGAKDRPGPAVELVLEDRLELDAAVVVVLQAQQVAWANRHRGVHQIAALNLAGGITLVDVEHEFCALPTRRDR